MIQETTGVSIEENLKHIGSFHQHIIDFLGFYDLVFELHSAHLHSSRSCW